MDYESYTNSIYNVNKKKKKNNFNNRNNNEEIEEEEAVGFKSAINMVNKKVFGGGGTNYNRKNNREDLEENDEEFENVLKKKNAPTSGTNNISSNSTGSTGFKGFKPPYKAANNANNANNVSTSKNKEKELDEKLKGFDLKLIEFIESEILNSSPNVNWEDIAGLEFAKKTIKEIIIWPLLRPDIFSGIRRPPKGLLLFGPPGTGKTMIAKAIASESKSKFFNISASSLMSKWIGESEKLVRTLFALASHYQPSVVFIDEIDSILTARSENECEASRRIKTEFLVQLDGAGTNQDDRILIIGATNRPQEIDDAFIRRLSKRLYIPLPNYNSRKQLIETVLKSEQQKQSKYELSEDDVVNIVNLTKGYSGSDMMNVCREAAMMPIRSIEDIFNVQLDNLRGINLNDFQEAINNVKPSVSDKTITQYVTWNKDFGSFQFDEKENDN